MSSEIEVQKDEIACPNAQLGSAGAQVHTLQACCITTTCSMDHSIRFSQSSNNSTPSPAPLQRCKEQLVFLHSLKIAGVSANLTI